MTMFNGLLAAAISLAGITAATTADAAIVFTISDSSFNGGPGISGSFTTDDDREAILDFSFTSGAGAFRLDSNPTATPIATSGFAFTAANSRVQLLSNGISIKVTGSDQTGRSLFLNFRPNTATLNLKTQFSFNERDAANERNSRIGSGWITATTVTAPTTGAVPEPATWAMMLIGFGGMGYAMRRRARVTTRIRFA